MRPRAWLALPHLAPACGLLVTCWLASAPHAAAPVPDLPVTATTLNHDYVVSWEPDPESDDYFPTSKAFEAALSLDEDGPANPPAGDPNGTHDGHERLGFREPFFSGDRLVNFYQCTTDEGSCDNGQANKSHIAMPADVYKDKSNSCIRMVLGHELFHHVEYAYDDDGVCTSVWGKAVCEGQARAMQDKIWDDLDTNPGASCLLGYDNQVNAFLAKPSTNIWNASYSAALWWTYLMEQFGENDEEPTLGADFLVKWWDLAAEADADGESGDAIQVTRDTIGFFSNRSLESVFQDFGIANWLNRTSLTGAPQDWRDRYQYVDDDEGFPYDRPFAFVNEISPGDPWQFEFLGIDTVTLGPWGTHYWRARTPACPAGGVIRVNITHENGQVGRQAIASFANVVGIPRIRNLWRNTGSSLNAAFVQPAGGLQFVFDVVLIVTTTSQAKEYKFSFSCHEPADIDNTFAPTPEPFDPTGPDTIVADNVIVDPPLDPFPLTGLPPEEFEVQVGGLQAELLAVAETDGRYWMRIAPPDGLPDGLADVEVSVGGGVPMQMGRVIVDSDWNPAGVLVFDTSLTMTPDKLEPLTDAATLLIDQLPGNHELGLVKFGFDVAEPLDDAMIVTNRAPLTSGHRANLLAGLNGLGNQLGGDSSIGDGILKALSLLGAADSPYMIVASDGSDPGPVDWDAVRGAVIASGVRIHTVAIGPAADVELLQRIARETAGAFHYPEIGDEVLVGFQQVFAQLADGIQGGVRRFVIEADPPVPGGDPVEVPLTIPADGEVQVAIFWGNAGYLAGLRRPDGSIVQRVDGDVALRQRTSSLVATIADATQDEVWSAVVLAPSAASGGGGGGGVAPIVTLAAANDDVPDFDLHLWPEWTDLTTSDPGVRLGEGAAVRIQTVLSDRLGGLDADDTRVFTLTPGGGETTQVLFGDGLSGRRPPSPGVKSGIIRKPVGIPRIFTADGRTFGDDRNGRPFQLARRLSIAGADPGPGGPPDADLDELPDRYEAQHGCLDPQVDDRFEDPDGDDLETFTEWVQGTLPCDDDTDEGGENDGSEILRGANPFDPADDLVQPIVGAWCVDKLNEHEEQDFQFASGEIMIRVPGLEKYANLVVKRGVDGGPLVPVSSWLVAEDVEGTIIDTGVENNRAYRYEVQPVTADGIVGKATLAALNCTAHASPEPPLGSVLIDGGAPRTDSRDVALTLAIDNRADGLAYEMQLGRTPALVSAPWERFSPTAPWTLEAGERQVYARFRDSTGRLSEVFTDDIRVLPSGSLGGIRGEVRNAAGDPLSGVDVSILGDPTAATALTGARGTFVLPSLMPATVTLRFARKGYGPEELPDVAIVAGETTEIGPILLSGDRDEDGVPDGLDNCVEVANGPAAGANDQVDSDEDGYGNACDCDFDQDETCGIADFSLFLPDFQSRLDSGVGTDMNADGRVDIEDFGSFLTGFQTGGPGPSALAP